MTLPPASSDRGRIGALWRGLVAGGQTYAWSEREVSPGDLVFFDHIADVNGDGETESLSGVGVVERVIGGQTIVCIAPALGAVRRVPVTPDRPSVRRDGARVLNVPVRPRGRAFGPRQGALSGQMLVGFGRL